MSLHPSYTFVSPESRQSACRKTGPIVASKIFTNSKMFHDVTCDRSIETIFVKILKTFISDIGSVVPLYHI